MLTYGALEDINPYAALKSYGWHPPKGNPMEKNPYRKYDDQELHCEILRRVMVHYMEPMMDLSPTMAIRIAKKGVDYAYEEYDRSAEVHDSRPNIEDIHALIDAGATAERIIEIALNQADIDLDYWEKEAFYVLVCLNVRRAIEDEGLDAIASSFQMQYLHYEKVYTLMLRYADVIGNPWVNLKAYYDFVRYVLTETVDRLEPKNLFWSKGMAISEAINSAYEKFRDIETHDGSDETVQIFGISSKLDPDTYKGAVDAWLEVIRHNDMECACYAGEYVLAELYDMFNDFDKQYELVEFYLETMRSYAQGAQ